MPEVSAILRHKTFWPFYVRATEDPLKGDILTHFDPSPDDEHEYLDVILPCGSEYALSLSISPDWYHIELGLESPQFDTPGEMGWWDEARWHPFAIRWNELLRLHQYWKDCSTLTIHPSSAFILVAVFVGTWHR